MSSGTIQTRIASRHDRREHELRQVAGEVGLERVDALHGGGGELAGAVADSAHRRAHEQLLGQAAAQLGHHARRRRSAQRPRRRRHSSARSGDHDDERDERPREAAERRAVHGRSGDHVGEQRRLRDDDGGHRDAEHRCEPQRARAARLSRSSAAVDARGALVARRRCSAAAHATPVPGRCVRCSCRRPTPGHRACCSSTAIGVGVALEVRAAEAVAEHPVGPGLVGEHDRHADDRDDRHHGQRVVRRGGGHERQIEGAAGGRGQRVGEQVDEQADEQQRDRGRAEGEGLRRRAAARADGRAPPAQATAATATICAARLRCRRSTGPTRSR